MNNNISVRLDTRRLNDILRTLTGNTDKVLKGIALMVETEAKISMAGPQSGAMYGKHRASAPGDPPAIDTGALAGSIYTATYTENKPPAEATQVLPAPERNTVHVGPAVEYAEYLEFGTVNMAPRPFMQPALNKVADAVRRDPSMFAEVVGG